MKNKLMIFSLICILISCMSEVAQTTSRPKSKEKMLIDNYIALNTRDKNTLISGDDQPKVIVTTIEVKKITATTATCNYSVKFVGLTVGTDIRAASSGVCVSKGPGPTTRNITFGVSKDCWNSTPVTCADLTNLNPGGKFYVRAYYTITQGKITGTFYGNEISFTTPAK
jgi:hypothetical protein